MYKNLFNLAFVLILHINISFAQVSLRDCNEVIDSRLKASIEKFDRTEFKSFMYKFLLSESEDRTNLKDEATTNLGIGVIIEDIPIDFDFGRTRDKKSEFLRSLKTEVEQKGYVSDSEVNFFVSEFFQPELFESYKECLKLTSSVLLNQNGVFANIEGDINDSFILVVRFTNNLGVDKVTIDKAVFDGSNIKYGNSFEAGTEIKNNQAIYQHLKRIPDRPLNISVSFRESIQGISATFPAEELRISSNKVPIGTIVASILDYQSFLDINDEKQTVFDIIKSTWSPCDGRAVIGSKYGSKRNNVPDLRGVFIRGINDMGVPGSANVRIEQLNPDSKGAGEFQNDEFEKHNHEISKGGRGISSNTQFAHPGDNAISPSYKSSDAGGNETRPKNITVYYYIKIN